MVKSASEELLDDIADQDLSFDTTCHTCFAEFLDAEDLDVHVKQMHSVTSLKTCQLCSDNYTDMIDYAAHVRDSHLFDIKCCRFCTKVFVDGRSFRMHEKKHLSLQSTYSCSQCNLMFADMTLLEMHERRNHDNETDGCLLKCMPFLSLILNLKAVPLLQSTGRRKFTCVSCKFTSYGFLLYKKHLIKNKCEGHACDKCSKLFKWKKYLIKHLKHTKRCLGEYSEETVTCKDCRKTIYPKSLLIHNKNCNALKCIVCKMIFKTIDELSDHQTIKHPLDMTLIRCKFCLKEFIGEAPLKKHITRVHKPNFHLYKYKCVDCNDIFQHPQKLFAHFFTKHKELEPFNCKICNKKFRVRKSFSLHIKLDHKSVGFVEFDENYHVFFTATKSGKQFVPECVVPVEEMNLYESENEELKKSKDPVRIQKSEKSDSDVTIAGSDDDEPLKTKQALKQIKNKRPKKTLKKEPVLIYSSDEEPLIAVRKRALKKKVYNRRNWSWKKKIAKKGWFTCEICNKNCYTYQNYQNHMSVHDKNQQIECVKCSKKFSSKSELSKHINKDHRSSRLTETLKNLLQKKKLDEPTDDPIFKTKKPERFTITMKKVEMQKSGVPATIKPVETDLSVKNFLENFTPDINESSKDKIEIEASVVIKRLVGPFTKKPMIKLTKFQDEPIHTPTSLKMPTRFKPHDHYVKTKISFKLVENPKVVNDLILPDYPDHNYSEILQDDEKDNDIPEVAHEVSLVGTEEPQEPTTTILIPKMPKGYTKIHIATLQQEAPYFKIIKVDSEKLPLASDEEEEIEQATPRPDFINLPGGTKLVTANPLAHLLGNTSVEKILEPIKNKHYKPVIKDFQGILAQAMQKLTQAPVPRKRKVVQKSKNDNKKSRF